MAANIDQLPGRRTEARRASAVDGVDKRLRATFGGISLVEIPGTLYKLQPADDPLADVAAPGRHVQNWQAMLQIGLEAMDETAAIAAIEARLRTGRPLASPDWIANAERSINRKLAPAKRGPKPREKQTVGSLV